MPWWAILSVIVIFDALACWFFYRLQKPHFEAMAEAVAFYRSISRGLDDGTLPVKQAKILLGYRNPVETRDQSQGEA